MLQDSNKGGDQEKLNSKIQLPPTPSLPTPPSTPSTPSLSIERECESLFVMNEQTQLTGKSKTEQRKEERLELYKQLKAICDSKGLKCPMAPSQAPRSSTKRLLSLINDMQNAEACYEKVDSGIPCPEMTQYEELDEQEQEQEGSFDEASAGPGVSSELIVEFIHQSHKNIAFAAEKVIEIKQDKLGISLSGFSDAIGEEREKLLPIYLEILRQHSQNEVVQKLTSPWAMFLMSNVAIASKVIASNKSASAKLINTT